MAKGKTSGKSDQNYWSRYKSNKTWEVNRKRKLTKHLKKHPNDTVAAKAITNIKYRRQTPKAPFWTPGMIRVASLFKQATGKVNTEMFNANHKIQQDAMIAYGAASRGTLVKVNQTSRVDFTLGARAHDRYGRQAWMR
jgi:hypothetical protein